jgi:hypothetical protein
LFQPEQAEFLMEILVGIDSRASAGLFVLSA